MRYCPDPHCQSVFTCCQTMQFLYHLQLRHGCNAAESQACLLDPSCYPKIKLANEKLYESAIEQALIPFDCELEELYGRAA